MLKTVSLLPERVSDWNEYPFSVPAINSLRTLAIRERVCFFTGENGTGKSTLLEAIASHYGFGREGGNRNFRNDSTENNAAIDPLSRALRLAFSVRTGAGFFLRAESFFNVATHIDEIGVVSSYGGTSLHRQSHGESFFTLLEYRMRENGLFLLDEPEAALSPQRQLSMLVLMHDVLRSHGSAQFIISTHSPILLGFPDAQILSFDDGAIREIAYDECPPVQIVRRFTSHRKSFLEELLQDEP
ncbi:AAA family ATPase [Terriglobus saanensis]|uniref:AAA ATPase n=1 Tax=Terriglobus saanensis (strain ATCC BAA-1853 / DSM 23119 / SP1PR4) TaxID=401053 RepID=E8V236_TERSS|nr:AAA family ATPase [Terriglobus saanensis]ADV84593.1 AAA ATPase [Terriglobus saanensis SP1PR4]